MSGTKEYAQGYAAGTKRVAKLKHKIAELRNERDAKVRLGDPCDQTIEFLLDKAELFAEAADSLINFRAKPESGEAAVRATVQLGSDGRCTCTCCHTCPLGRTGMSYRCTRDELISAGIEVNESGETAGG